MTKIIEPEKDDHPRGGSSGRAAAMSSWEKIDEIMRSGPEEALQRVPANGAEQHDHYLYGSPKRTPRAS